MNGLTECPVCRPYGQQVEALDGGNRMNVCCERCGIFQITIGAARKVIQSGMAGHLSAWIRDHKESGRSVPEITRDNLDSIVDSLPKYGASDKQRILLQSLERKTKFLGEELDLSVELDFPLAWASQSDEFRYLLKAMADRGLVDAPFGFHNASCSVIIAPLGWDALEKISRPSGDGNQAFVAMSFAKEVHPTWKDGIKPSLERAGYRAYRVDDDPHIGRIDAKIMTEIKNSRFVIADVTDQRPGVYFEAGYAIGLGLPVIWSVREDDLRNVHFDTRQYNHIVWKREDDLEEQLYNRVLAVIGSPGD